MSLPPATPNPCDECPWRRDSLAGYLGPLDAEGWIQHAHGDFPIACHKTIAPKIGQAEWDDPGIRQCRGAASFRANVCKEPRDPEVISWPPDPERVFDSNEEFLDHHRDSLFARWQSEQAQ